MQISIGVKWRFDVDTNESMDPKHIKWVGASNLEPYNQVVKVEEGWVDL